MGLWDPLFKKNKGMSDSQRYSQNFNFIKNVDKIAWLKSI